MLVQDLADQFLDDVLEGDYPGRTAVLVDDHGDGLLVAQPLQELLHGHRLGDELGLYGDPADRHALAFLRGDGERVLQMGHADDLVDALAVDGEAGQAGGAGQVDHVGRRGVRLEGYDLHARGHDVLRGEMAEGQGPYEQVRRVLFERAGQRGVSGQRDQLAACTGRGQLVGRLHAEEPHEPVGHRVEQGDDGPEDGGEQMLRSRDEARDLQRPGHRPVLRHEFADDHLDGGGEEHADHHGDAGHGPFGEARGREGAVEQLGERGLGEHADDEGGDGDAELGAGELEGQLPQGADDGAGAAVARRGSAFGVRPVHGHETELGRHEEAVGEDEKECRGEQQKGDGHAAASSKAAAQVLPDDPSIAGGSHSSGRRMPRGPVLTAVGCGAGRTWRHRPPG